MYILNCISESGDCYVFKANRKPSKEEFDSFCKNTYPDEYDKEDEYNYISIVECLEIENVKEIKLKD